MSDIIKISVPKLKSYKQNFNNEQNNFNNSTYQKFSSSYFNRCSDTYVSRMKSNLSFLYSKLKNGYRNIDKWWTDYNENTEGLESSLSNDTKSGSISESSIRSYVNVLPELANYNMKFSGTITTGVISAEANATFINNEPTTVIDFISQLAKSVPVVGFFIQVNATISDSIQAVWTDLINQSIDKRNKREEEIEWANKPAAEKEYIEACRIAEDIIPSLPEDLGLELTEKLNENYEMLNTLEVTEIEITEKIELYEKLLRTYDGGIPQYYFETIEEYEAFIEKNDIPKSIMPFMRNDEDYQVALDKWYRYDEALTEFLIEMGVTEVTGKELDSTIADLKSELNMITEMKYTLRQEIKSLPYQYMLLLEDFNKYGNFSAYENVELVYQNYGGNVVQFPTPNGIEEGKINVLAIAQLYTTNPEYANKLDSMFAQVRPESRGIYDVIIEKKELLNYISEDEMKIYNYIFMKEGRDSAENYLEDISDIINQRKGIVEASEFLFNLNDSSKFSQFFMALGGGTGDGVKNFFDGVENAFNADGVKTNTQYKQMIILQALNNMLNNEEFVKSAKDSGYYDIIIEVVDKNRENLSETEIFNQITQDHGEYGQVLSTTYQFGTSFGNMLPAMTTAMIVSAFATPMVGAEVAGTISSLASNTLMGVSSFGNAKNEMLIEGRSQTQSMWYAFLTASSEVGLQYFVGNIPGLNSKAKFALKEIISEGVEEGLQSFLGRFITAVSTGEEINFDGLSEEMTQSFLMGCLMSTVLTGGQAIITLGGNQIKLSPQEIKNIINSNDMVGALNNIVNTKASNIGYKFNTENLQKGINIICENVNNSGYIPMELGKYFEENFYDPNYVYGIHKSGSVIIDINDMSVSNKIMNEGLYLSGDTSSGINLNSIDLNKNIIFRNKNSNGFPLFLNDIQGASGYKTNFGVGDAIIIKIPTAEYNNVSDLTYYKNGRAYLKPEYVMGYVRSTEGNLSQFNPNTYIDVEHIENINIAKKAITDIDPRLLELYNKGKLTGRDRGYLLGYEEHNFIHVYRVAEESVNVLEALNNLMDSGKLKCYKKINPEIVYKAGIIHDLGMSAGGYALCTINGKKGLIEITELASDPIKYSEQLKELKIRIEDGDIEGQLIRASHAVNSAILTLQNSEIFGADTEMLACLALIHSKSTSGVKKIDLYSQLSSMVENLYQNQMLGDTRLYDFDVSKLVECDSNGVPITREIIENDVPKKVYVFKEGVIEEFRTGAVALRVGDAHATKTGYNHGGGKINIIKRPDSTIAVSKIGQPIQDLYMLEASQAEINIDYLEETIALYGGSYEVSKSIVLGESNVVTMDSIVENGLLTHRHVVKTTDSPASTWKWGIEEKFGEYETFANIKQKVIVELPPNSSKELLQFYNEYKKNYLQINNDWINIEIIVGGN